ncbi:MAG: hypothetical protein V4667_06470 [Bacteroidota bacterium]
MTIINKLISFQFPSPTKYIFWIVLALLLRGSSALFFSNGAKKIYPENVVNGIAVKQNDYYMFLGVIDTYFETGTMSIKQGKPFAGRMPGYGIPYAIFQFVFSKEVALTSLILCQILLSSIAVYVLAKTSYLLWNNEKIFTLSFLLFGLSCYTSIYDIFSLSESFAVSAIVFCMYYIVKYFKEYSKKYLVVGGFFLAWAIFLRPFLGILIVIFSLLLFFNLLKKFNLKKAFIAVAVFCSAFIVMETAWIYRNYKALNKFVPLETSLEESYGKYGTYRKSAEELRLLINAWGGETGDFYDISDAWWFAKAKGRDIENYKFHTSVYNAGISQERLIQIKNLYAESVKSKYSDAKKDTLNTICISLIKTVKQQYLISNTFRSKVVVPFIRIKRLILSNPTLAMPLPTFEKMNLIEKGIKLVTVALYFFVLLLSVPAIIKIKKTIEEKTIFYILVSIPLSIIVLFTFMGIAITENRYFLSAYPILILFVSAYIVSILKSFKNK